MFGLKLKNAIIMLLESIILYYKLKKTLLKMTYKLSSKINKFVKFYK